MNKASFEYVELKHYRLIREIIERKTVSSAARELFLSQSAASRQLSDLEYAVGSPVFSRINKQMVPTAIGRLLGELAIEIQNRIDQTKVTIDEMYNGLGGNLRFGSLCPHSFDWMSDFIISIRKEYPNFSFSFHNVKDTFELLESNVDFIITSIPFVNERIVSTKLFSDEMVVVVPSDHKIAKRKYVHIKELFNESVFFYFSEASQNYRYYIGQMEIGFKRRFSSAPHIKAALSMVRAGMGITFMPRWALQEHGADLSGVRLFRNGYPLTWNIMYLPSSLSNHRFIIKEIVKFTEELIR